MRLIPSKFVWISYLFGLIVSWGIILKFNHWIGFLAWIPWVVIVILYFTQKKGLKK